MLAKHKGNLSKMEKYQLHPEGWEIFNSFLLHVLVMVVWDDPPSQVTKTPGVNGFKVTFFPGHVCFSSMTDLLSALVWGLETSTTKVWWLREFGIPKWSNAVADGGIHSLKTNSLPLKMGDPKRNFHLPTIHFQGRAVELRGVFIDLQHILRDVNQNSLHFQVWLAGDAFLYQKETWIHLHVWRYCMVCWKEHR